MTAMTNLAYAIHSFQNGTLSLHEFLAQVDRALMTDEANTVRLLEMLGDEKTRAKLPPDVYAELQRRIEFTVASRHGFGGDETHVQTNPRDRWPAHTMPSTPSTPSIPSLGLPGGHAGMEPERLKGVGDTLNGRFVLEECIGFGGMGTVYKALDLRKLEASDRKPYIAIKVLNVQFRGHPKSLIALQREARKAQSLAHPNIVAVYDFDRDGSMVYLTMECLSGKPLSQTLRTPGFAGMPYAQAMHIVEGVAKALAYAHERGFVHCDLKPANVFVTNANEVKVIDFGIARVFRKPEEDVEATVFDPGSLGALTPAYASPEMQEHREPDPRDDIYALACITYELMTGRHPFDRLSAIQARGAGMKVPRPKNLGYRQWRALKHALSFERETRTPTVARFMEEMREPRRTGLYVTLGAAGVVVAGAIAAFYYYHESRSGEEARTRTATVEPPASVQQAAPQAAKPATPPQVAPQTPPQTASQSMPTQPPPPLPALTLASVTPILSQVPCAALAPSASDHELQVQGYLPASFGVPILKEKLSSVPGMTTLKLDVQEVNDDKCKVVQAFAPYWITNRQAATPAAIHTRATNAQLTEGDPLIVDIETPSYESYVYVDYYALDGSVAHLVPNPRAKANQAPANYKATIGGLGNWVISKPFGTELIVLLITPAPLFDAVRPASEPAAEYLKAAEKQLQLMATKQKSNKIVADFVQITTKAK
jgi:eukaryotic-like serine/threonine-protein kinase